MKGFAELLREARIRAGLTQKELAEHAGVDHSYISKIERGVYDPPSREIVLAIAEVLRIEGDAERLYLLLAAGCASVEDIQGLDLDALPDGEAEGRSPLRASSFHFPQLEQLEKDALIEKITNLLENPKLTGDLRSEYIKLIDAFITWLEFNIRGETNE